MISGLDAPTISDVHSENVDASIGTDRRTRKREARRDGLLGLAGDIVERHGIDGLTMAALAEAADYAPASLYTYFSSRSALLSALQQQALGVLAEVADLHGSAVETTLADRAAIAEAKALARLLAFSRLFLTAPDHHPREFHLQQAMLVAPGPTDADDVLAVVPAAMAVLERPRRLLAAAVAVGVLDAHESTTDPIDQPLDGDLVRTLAWVSALNGALLVDGIAAGLPTTGAALGEDITRSFLRGWGAAPDDLAAAVDLAADLPGAGDTGDGSK